MTQTARLRTPPTGPFGAVVAAVQPRPTFAVTCLALAALALGAPSLVLAGSFQVPRLPGATASPTTVPEVVGPQPVGDGVVYASGSRAVGWTVWLARPGVARRSLTVIPPVPGSSSDEITVRASMTRLVLTHVVSVCPDPSEACKYGGDRVLLDVVLAGPLGGPLEPVRRCQAGLACTPADTCPDGSRTTTSLDGDLLGVLDGCSRTAAVVNLASGASTGLGPAEALGVAGGFAVVAEPVAGAAPGSQVTTLVVHDAATGAEVYRPGLPAINFGAPHFALAADGTLVYSAPLSGAALAVASPTAPAGRVLRAAGPEQGIVGASPTGVLTGSVPSGLELVPLDGSQPRTLEPIDLLDRFDTAFDGRTIVVRQGYCGTTTITSWRVDEPAPALVDDHCPTARPSRAAVTLARDRRLGVEVGCPARPRGGCAATVRLTLVGRARRRAAHAPTYPLGSVEVALDPGTRAPAEVLATPGAARWARRHDGLRLRLLVHNRFLGQLPRGDSGEVTQAVAVRVQARGVRAGSAAGR